MENGPTGRCKNQRNINKKGVNTTIFLKSKGWKFTQICEVKFEKSKMVEDNLNPIIWISGAINAGKTTICNLLHKQIKRSVHIELDSLSAFERYTIRL